MDSSPRPDLKILIIFILSLWSLGLYSQVPTPERVFGFEPGADFKLASYQQLLDFYQQLAAASPRVELEEIGTTVLGRPLLLLYISSAENIKQLDRWKQISRELANAHIDDETAQSHAEEGKAIVWIDGGLHATEVAPSQMLPRLAHHVATDESVETRKIRDNTIMLLMPSMNPDGLEVVRQWYERNLETPFETTRPPELYHHYVGHDNNRDWFMNNMPETAAVSRMLYEEWFPQIVYNHHQTGPSWARIFLPPFADPVNPNIHPGVTTGVNMVGSAMSNRFAMKKMPGAVSDMIYSMWWNGGMRTVPYFHNIIGILTETSHATASPRYYDPEERPAQVGNPRRGQSAPTSGVDIFYPYPWPGGDSRFSDPVRYTFTASMAVLDIAADLKSRWLYGIYSMGRDAINAAEQDRFAYVIPTNQWDPNEARNLVKILMQGGIEIQQASEGFSAGEQVFAAGSYIVYGDQAFRNYAIDLLEAQQ
ncbi:MAG: peptidase M14, partial [Gammaproteobacteria bacterium]|nr:peptidase M14 [Gammaproteobacteria bacterium]